MTSKAGNYFKDKQEAIEFYKNNEENLKDKPDWMIECIIDFAIQYPNYKEYCEVEAKVKRGEKLTARQQKKYGHLKWEKEMTEYKDGDVINDAVECHAAGTYEDIVHDPVAREKYNKFNLQFGESLKPDTKVGIVFKDSTGETLKGEVDVGGDLGDAKISKFDPENTEEIKEE
jgi:hypothetical protein